MVVKESCHAIVDELPTGGGRIQNIEEEEEDFIILNWECFDDDDIMYEKMKNNVRKNYNRRVYEVLTSKPNNGRVVANAINSWPV